MRPISNLCAGVLALEGTVIKTELTRSPLPGGDYTVENIIVSPITEYYGLEASLPTQVKQLPDDSPFRFRITDSSILTSPPRRWRK